VEDLTDLKSSIKEKSAPKNIYDLVLAVAALSTNFVV
jgi:hypothetical protein